MDVTIYPDPNPAVTAALRGERMRAIVFEKTEIAHALYVEQVAKRTGRLAASAHATTEIGGIDHDRWGGVLTVGGIGSTGTVDYALPHEFGRGEHPESEFSAGFGGEHIVQQAANDLNRVLEELGGL